MGNGAIELVPDDPEMTKFKEFLRFISEAKSLKTLKLGFCDHHEYQSPFTDVANDLFRSIGGTVEGIWTDDIIVSFAQGPTTITTVPEASG